MKLLPINQYNNLRKGIEDIWSSKSVNNLETVQEKAVKFYDFNVILCDE